MAAPLTWDADLNGTPLTWDSAGLTWDGELPVTPSQTHSMAIDNKISLNITAAQKTALETAIAALKAALLPIVINLTKDERQTLAKIGDKTLAFDDKCKAYMASRPELIPGYVDMAEVAIDRADITALLPCFRELAPLCEGLEDTVCLIFSDLYISDRAFFASVREAARRGVAGTDTIYDDLKVRFPGRPPGPTPPTP